ncbi:MAG: NfeD family protein [Euryarchaeota archaeon]
MIAADSLANTGVASVSGVALLWLGSWLKDYRLLLVTGPPGALILAMQIWGVLRRGTRAQRSKVGPRDAGQLVGEEGVVISEDPPRVEVDGEVWDAVSEVELTEGDRVVVKRVLGSRLEVEPVKSGRSSRGEDV